MIAIISDVHGNYPALEAVLKDIDNIRCDKIISLGDICGYYCMLNECVEELRKRNVVNILGNHDAYLINGEKCSRSTVVNQCIDYQRQIISEQNYKYLLDSVGYLDTELISARHGGWNDLMEEYVSEFDFSVSDNYTCNLFCSGHTHIQKYAEYKDDVYFNPGSVGQPRDGDPRAAYAVITDDKKILLKRVRYNIDIIADEMRKEGFPDRIFECLFTGNKIS